MLFAHSDESIIGGDHEKTVIGFAAEKSEDGCA
jgi:hypothetical protein